VGVAVDVGMAVEDIVGVAVGTVVEGSVVIAAGMAVEVRVGVTAGSADMATAGVAVRMAVEVVVGVPVVVGVGVGVGVRDGSAVLVMVASTMTAAVRVGAGPHAVSRRILATRALQAREARILIKRPPSRIGRCLPPVSHALRKSKTPAKSWWPACCFDCGIWLHNI